MPDEKQVLQMIGDLDVTLRDKIAERDLLNIQIMEIEKNLHNLNVMFIKDALFVEGRRLTAVGLTEAIRTVLRRHGRPMTPAAMKDALNVVGFDLGRFKNPSAAIHNTLLRMAEADELTYDTENKTYRISFPNLDALMRATTVDKIRGIKERKK